jgi:retinol dehydrogenase-12
VETDLHRDNRLLQVQDQIIGRTPQEGGRLPIHAQVVKGAEAHGKYLSEVRLTESVVPFRNVIFSLS